jgi:hypothetical protein
MYSPFQSQHWLEPVSDRMKDQNEGLVGTNHSNMVAPKYNADMVAGSLMVPESRKIARLLLEQADDIIWYQSIVVGNILQKRSPATAKRQSRLIRNRLKLMTPDLWELIVEGPSEVATQAVLAAAIKQSRLLGDFMDQVVRHHVKTFDPQLKTKDWSMFVENCEQLHHEVATWSESTCKKLKQVILRILAEAGYLDSTRSLRITPVTLTDQVRTYLVDNNEDYVLRCMEVTT